MPPILPVDTARIREPGSPARSGASVAPEAFCVVRDLESAKVQKTHEHRRTKRRQVLKRAQLVFGYAGSTIDCLIIDETPFGVLLETPLMTSVPDHVKLRFVGGATFDTLKRWANGNKMGLEYVGSQIFDEATLRQRRVIEGVLKTQGVNAAVYMLREIRFFESPELQHAAEAAEIAVARLESLLN